jgi:methylenetetrahydrofolate dehydrogenase (NADP+)/methenyltetrahydrofolate cyclohydrolase
MILDGKDVAKKIQAQIQLDITTLKTKIGVIPGLAVIIIGENPASMAYVRNKEKACAKAGIYSCKLTLDAKSSEEAVITHIQRLNNDPLIHGILLQSPIPAHMDYDRIVTTILPEKDMDGFHPINMGNLVLRAPCFYPCTPLGIMRLLEYYTIPIEGRHIVIVGRSNIVGKPLALMFLARHATVTICHSRTSDLAAITRQADILIAAVGRSRMITADMVREGAVVVDVGINQLEDKTMVGDVDFESVSQKAAAITPVPGGVGPMTVTMLLHNTLTSAVRFARKAGHLVDFLEI